MVVSATHALPQGAIAGDAPGTAIRVRTRNDGQTCLEQLGFSRSSGWHVQKSFTIPASMLPAVLLELRKADCLHPSARAPRRNLTPNTHLRLCL